MGNLNLKNSVFLKKYEDDATKAFMKMHPEWNEKDVRKEIKKMLQKSITIPDCEVDNNYTRQRRETNLLSVVDWSLDEEKRKETGKEMPLMAGNGTFYKNQHEAINPIATMLTGFLTKRKNLKKQMFAIEDSRSREYQTFDLKQGIEKINANSYYGGSGMKSSAFYSEYSGPATTISAQSVISTAYATFEAFLSDNFYFYSINECFNWVEKVLNKISNDGELDTWVKPKTKEAVYEKLKYMFFDWKDEYDEIIHDLVNSFTEEELTRIYYINRLEEFTRDHKEIIDLNKKILDEILVYPVMNKKDPLWRSKVPNEITEEFESVSKYNSYVCKLAFMDPNDPPKNIKDDLEKLKEYYMKYVYIRYSAFDRIYRLKNFTRKSVVIIDTDSNIIALDHWMEFLFDLFASESDKPKDNIEFILINTITYTLSAIITDTLLKYGEDSNVPEEYRPIYTMKNEFFMRRIAIANTKKRYLSLFKLREGNLLDPPKIDIKGFDFKKAGTSDSIEKMFTDITENYILKSERIDVPTIVKKLQEMEIMVEESLKKGENEFLPIGNAKELNAYKDPFSEQSVRAVNAWNIFYPDKMIELPSKVKLLKLNFFNLDDIEDLKETYPKEYQILYDRIFHDTTGYFVTTRHVGKTNENVPYIRGLQCIAIPTNENIPEWIRPYIDYRTMVNNIMGPYKSVMELLKMPYVSEGKTKNGVSRKTKRVSNIIIF